MRRILNQCANAAAKSKGTIFEIVYRRLVSRLGHNQTIGAIMRKDHLLRAWVTAGTGFVLITTRPRALAAIAFTLWTFVQGVRSLSSTRPYSLIWLYSGLLPHWAVLLITIAFYGALVWIAVNIVSAPSRKEEKALMFTVCAVPLLAPLGVLLPRATSLLRFLQALLELAALLASISILLFLQTDREEKPREEEGI